MNEKPISRQEKEAYLKYLNAVKTDQDGRILTKKEFEEIMARAGKKQLEEIRLARWKSYQKKLREKKID